MGKRDREAQCISIRQWDSIRKAWEDYIPTYPSPWPKPDHELAELNSLSEELQKFSSNHQRNMDKETLEYDIPGLRASVLHEAVTLLHKAANVLRAMEVEAVSGYGTWSRSSAYHSAFFAMRGVLGVLGVVVVPANARKRNFQIDIWAPRRKKVSTPTANEFAIRITPRKAVQHKELWSLFTRVLRANKIDQSVWPYLGNDVLRDFDPGKFSIIRHRLHYRSTGWIYDDLWDDSNKQDLGGLAHDVLDIKYLDDPNHDSFPPSLALHILSMGMALLSDLGSEVPRIREEVERAESLMKNTAWSCANAFEVSGKGRGNEQ